MLIAVNTRFLIKDKLEGIGWYTYEVFRRLVTNHPEHEFLFLFDRDWDPEYKFASNVTPVKVWPPARHPYLWQFWFDYSLPSIFKKYKPDLFISPDGFLSLKTHIPTLLVIHDLGFEHYPEHTPPLVNKYYRKFTPLYARHADRVVTVSDFTRKDVIDRYSIEENKVRAIYNGASDLYKPANELEKRAVREKFTDNKPYFVYVGSIHPRKNVSSLLLAYDQLRSVYDTDIKLVIAGRMAWKTDETKQVLDKMKFKDDVVVTGHLLQTDLSKLVAAAQAFVYPSLFEGFGIPVVEARYCGVPIISSDRTCLNEVAGDDALYFNPEEIDSMVAAMKKFLENPGKYQAKFRDVDAVKAQFNWDKSAAELAEVIHEMDHRFIQAQNLIGS